MSKVCIICEKSKAIGRHVARRGMAKAKGGAGRKITGISKRVFRPNVQKIRILNDKNQVIAAYICTKCLKAGKVKKA